MKCLMAVVELQQILLHLLKVFNFEHCLKIHKQTAMLSTEISYLEDLLYENGMRSEPRGISDYHDKVIDLDLLPSVSNLTQNIVRLLLLVAVLEGLIDQLPKSVFNSLI